MYSARLYVVHTIVAHRHATHSCTDMPALATGAMGPTTRWNGCERIVEPDPGSAMPYESLYGVFRESYGDAVRRMHARGTPERANGLNDRSHRVGPWPWSHLQR